MKHSLFWLLDHYPETGESVAAIHEAALELAAEADAQGYDALWLAEHHFHPLGTAANPAVLLAAMAQRTQRIRLGPAVAVLPLRDPIQVAEDYALVDAISAGRLNMGVGMGSRPTEYEPFGVDFETRRTRYMESLATLRTRWAAAVRGELGVRSLNVAPIQSPTPPIYVATMSEGTAYEVGLAGDSLLTLVPMSAEGLDDVVARVRAHARGLEETGQSRSRAESVVMIFAHVAETQAQAQATAFPALARLVRSMQGSELEDAASFYEQARRNDAALFGTPDDVGQQLQRLCDLGLGHVACVTRFGGIPQALAARSQQLLASATP